MEHRRYYLANADLAVQYAITHQTTVELVGENENVIAYVSHGVPSLFPDEFDAEVDE